MSIIKVVFSTKVLPVPYAPLAVAFHLRPSVDVSFDQNEGRDSSISIPSSDSKWAVITGLAPVLRALGRFVMTPHHQLYGSDAIRATQIDYWIDFAQNSLSSTVFNQVSSALDELNRHLKLRSFIVGYNLTLADYAIWGALKSSTVYLGLLKSNKVGLYLTRWYDHVSSVPSVMDALTSFEKAKSGASSKFGQQGNMDLDLIGAEEGKVVTRFPPEPSGYLHIGHAKAVLLNQYYAQKYKGTLILRFDDTNPSKEKGEYEESIKEDLTLIDVYPDKITHTSDYFDLTYDYAIKMINLGKAFVDNTDQDTMKEERTAMKDSKCRYLSIEENLKRFEEMRQATEFGLKCCLRAKINMQDVNGTLRDPVIYRCNLEPHHRTGTRYKMYPTYDFVCPIIDSHEGVTHALRDKAYRDRNQQFEWFLKTLNLRWVYIRDFSRINFVYTLMSKRKLNWFVTQGRVSGWDDPRFPTIRGIRRRGLTIEALRRYILTQGASLKDMLLEWDKIWTENKRVIDPVAPRHTAIAKVGIVKVHISGNDAPSCAYSKEIPKHKKNPDVGVKKTVFSSTIYLEQADAELLEMNEEITLMDWGNAIVTHIAHKEDKNVIELLHLRLHLEGDFKKTKKKLTWLSTAGTSNDDGPVNVVLHDYDYLITKKKLEEDEEMQDVLTPTTEFTTECIGDGNLKSLKKGDIIQFERKGFYICDAEYGSNTPDPSLHFILIPDGSDKTTASKADTSTTIQVESKSTTTRLSKATEKSKKADNKHEVVNDTSSRDSKVCKMYYMPPIYGDIHFDPTKVTKMYAMSNMMGRNNFVVDDDDDEKASIGRAATNGTSFKPAKQVQPAKTSSISKPEASTSSAANENNNDHLIGRLDIVVGKILEVRKHPDADSLYVEKIDCGEPEPREVVSGLVKFMTENQMKGKDVLILKNLNPASMRGIKSHAMVLCASDAEHSKVEFLIPPTGSTPGDKVYFEGHQGEPEAQLNPKKKVWETIQPELTTSPELVAMWKSIPFRTSKGVVKVDSLVGATIK